MIRQRLEYIAILAEEKSMTRAAERLGITQSAFSQYLMSLEKNLGIPLFSRVRNQIALTYAGEIYLAAALDILKIQKDLINQINDISTSCMGEVSFGIEVEQGIYILPRLYSAFSTAFPEATLHIEQGMPQSLEEWAQMGHCDIVLLPLFDRTTTLESECIGQDELLLVVPAGHPLAALTSHSDGAGNHRYNERESTVGRSDDMACRIQNRRNSSVQWPIIDPALLHKAPFVLPAPNSVPRQIADAIFHANNIQPNIIFESNTMATVYDTAISINALCLVPESLVCLRDPQRHHFYYSIDRARYSMQMVVAWRRGAYLSQTARALIEIL